METNVSIEVCKRSKSEYQNIRDRHYIENKGCHGQQIHFLIKYNNNVIGIISGASSVYGVKARDEFFNFPDNREVINSYYLPAIISNNVFRLEYHEKNLGTKILKLWRDSIAFLWEKIYEIPVIGFETFIIENENRKGSMYKADNWTFVGRTAGSTKSNKGMGNKHKRHKTCKKLIFCRWKDMKEVEPQVEYQSCWRRETIKEKQKYTHVQKWKNNILGLEIYRNDDIKEKIKEIPRQQSLFSQAK